MDDFFYDCTDDFSPFGNDDGADTVAALEAWFREGKAPEGMPSLLRSLLAEWDYDVPESLHAEFILIGHTLTKS